MKKILFFLLIALPVLCLTSCNTDDDYDVDWYNANVEAYEAIANNNTEYKIVELEGASKKVYHKVLKKGEGTEHPIQTGGVKILFTKKDYTGAVLESKSDPEYPVSFLVSGAVSGLQIALQGMVVGDKWEIVIPWYLGHGSSGGKSNAFESVDVKGYTTLFYEVELLQVANH